MIKVLARIEMKGTYLNTIKALYDKSSSNIIPDKEGAHQSNLINCPIAMILFNIMLEVIAREIREGN